MKIGIMGGTFNPPHNGHILAASNTLEQLGLDKVLLIPNNIPPHKELPRNSATTEQRLEMTRLAAKHIQHAEVSDIEIKREGASYTIDTIYEIRDIYRDCEIYFIMGTDMLLSIEKWRQPDEIMKNCALAVVARNEKDRESIIKQANILQKKYDAQVHIIHCDAFDVSSTEIRQGIKNDIPPEIAKYIKEHALYI